MILFMSISFSYVALTLFFLFHLQKIDIQFLAEKHIYMFSSPDAEVSTFSMQIGNISESALYLQWSMRAKHLYLSTFQASFHRSYGFIYFFSLFIPYSSLCIPSFNLQVEDSQVHSLLSLCRLKMSMLLSISLWTEDSGYPLLSHDVKSNDHIHSLLSPWHREDGDDQAST